MSRSISIFIILLLIMFAFLFLRDFKSNVKSKDAEAKPQNNTQSQAAGETVNPNLQNWREFTSIKKNFKIFLPSLPQHLADKAPDPATGEMRKYDTYLAAGDNGTAFMVNTITLTKKLDLKDADAALQNVIAEIISRNKENKLESSKAGKFRDYPALDFFISSKDAVSAQDTSIAGKVFTDGNTIYILSMISDPAKSNPDELALFVNSFELLNKS